MGVIFTDRVTVNQIEGLKASQISSCSIGYFDCLLSFTSISAEIKDPDLLALIKQLGYKKDTTVVTRSSSLI